MSLVLFVCMNAQISGIIVDRAIKFCQCIYMHYRVLKLIKDIQPRRQRLQIWQSLPTTWHIQCEHALVFYFSTCFQLQFMCFLARTWLLLAGTTLAHVCVYVCVCKHLVWLGLPCKRFICANISQFGRDFTLLPASQIFLARCCLGYYSSPPSRREGSRLLRQLAMDPGYKSGCRLLLPNR